MKTGNLDGQRIAELQNYKFQMLASAPNPLEAIFYYDTTLKCFRYYNGTEWIDGSKYIAGNGVDITDHTISIKLATGGNAGNITLSTDSTGLYANVANASTGGKGIIEIATDAEAIAGTATDLAITPKQLATKIGLGDLSIKSDSTNYLAYDMFNGTIGAKVDTTVTENSTKLVTSGAVSNAIGLALTGALKYQGTWTATNQSSYATITLPVKKGYMYAVNGTTTINDVEWNSGDYLVINTDVASGGTISPSYVDKIDNTEASNIVRLSATQTLTNKTIDANDNTISNLTVDNLKSGVLQTTIRGIQTASDTALLSEKAIVTKFASLSYSETNPALTESGGLCTWTVTHNLGSEYVNAIVYDSSNKRVMYDYDITNSNTIKVYILSENNISANAYKVVVQR